MMSDNLMKLYNEIKTTITEYGEKREFYERRVTRCNILYLILAVCPIVAIIAIPSNPNLAIISKIIAVIIVSLSSILTRVIKIKGYGEKLLQRSVTYFKLCDLARDIRLDKNANENYEDYKNEFKRIMERDNKSGLYNSIRNVDILNDNMQISMKKEKEIREKKEKAVNENSSVGENHQ